MDYETIQSVSATVGLLLFIAAFVGIFLWAFRPGVAKEMKEHAEIPLKDEEEK